MRSATAPPLWLLVLVTFSGTLAMHMFVPALGSAARDLDTSPSAIQFTISLYILGLALGQLVYGPVSDQVGRRPALLFGLGLFTVASVVCMTATSVGMLVVARFAQALGGCSGLMLGRTIVRDTSNPEETMRRLASMQLVTLIGPGLAPLLGALIAGALGWRWIFGLFAALGVAALAASWRLLAETRAPRERNTGRSLASDYASLVRSPVFIACVIGGGCSTTSFYAFVATAPFVLGERFSQPVGWVGFDLFLMVVGISLGNLASGRLAARLPLIRVMLIANAIALVSATLLVAQFGLGIVTVGSAVATMFLFCLGAGLCSPAVVTQAMSTRPSVAGSASGIYGFGQMAIGALCTAAVALGHDHGLTASLVLLVASVIAQASFQVVRACDAGRALARVEGPT